MKSAIYKGKTYNLLFLGTTKFGKKAKLGFLNDEKDFWVDASLVEVVSGTVPEPARSAFNGRSASYGKCRERGCQNSASLNAPHHSAMGGYCGYCAFDEFDM